MLYAVNNSFTDSFCFLLFYKKLFTFLQTHSWSFHYLFLHFTNHFFIARIIKPQMFRIITKIKQTHVFIKTLINIIRLKFIKLTSNFFEQQSIPIVITNIVVNSCSENMFTVTTQVWNQFINTIIFYAILIYNIVKIFWQHKFKDRLHFFVYKEQLVS